MLAVRIAWSCRWSFLRITLASLLVVALLSDNPSRLARLQFEKLPAADYIGEARKLASAGRFSEALIAINAGLDDDDQISEPLREEKERIEAERDSTFRKLKQFAGGFVFGSGDSMESLAGTISADFFVVGDVRDLLIEGTKQITGEGADELIVLLSAVGVATTVAPQFDVVASFLKIAKKAGALSKRLMKAVTLQLRNAVSLRSFAPIRGFFSGLGSMMEQMSGSGALRLLKHVDDPKEIEAIAGFLKKHRSGGYALGVAGREGLDAIKRGAGDALVMATKKGRAGIAWMRTARHRLLKPHVFLGATKGLYKGTVGKLADRLVRNYLDPGGRWIIAGLCAWLVIECSMIHRRLKPKAIAALSPA